MNSLFIISPAYNEESAITSFIKVTSDEIQSQGLDQKYRCVLLVVDDGSRDQTYVKIKQASPTISNVKVIGLKLSRNFGQQAALQAGLEYAHQMAEAHAQFIIMDSDLQHPPRLLSSMVSELNHGADHVQMIRVEERGVSFFKKITSYVFYKIFKKFANLNIEPGSSDFRAFSKSFLDAYLKLQEKQRFNRGLFHWVGFKSVSITYQPDQRVAGETKYSFKKMLKLSYTAILQFSSKPLLYVVFSSVGLSIVGCLSYFIFEIVRYFQGHTFVLGWPSMMFFISFWSGLILLGQMMLAIYVARIFDEIKQRPVYLIKEKTTD